VDRLGYIVKACLKKKEKEKELAIELKRRCLP
jgi:hypothetical protein